MIRIAIALLLLAGSVSTLATPYVVEYSAANGVFPEDSGWTRLTFQGGAQRWFDDAALVVDSRASADIVDSYSMVRPGQLDPSEPGEWFAMSWRMRTDELEGPWDSFVGVFSDERRLAALDFSLSGVHVSGQGFIATFEPGVFHNFEFRSSDMLSYELQIDGAVAYRGNFTDPLVTASKIAWGDDQGGAGLTLWDMFSFGVFPEPMSALMGVTLLAVARAVSRGISR